MATQKVFVLKKPIVYEGRNFFGRKAKLGFTPQSREMSGPWFWRGPSVSKNIHEIEPGIIQGKNRRIELVNRIGTLSVYEHIGVLRFFNLVGGLEIGGIGWPPYDGGAIGLWKAIKPACVAEKMDVPLYSVSKTVRYEYKNMRGDRKAFTEIRPSSDGRLTLDITRSFSGRGTYRHVFQFPDNELLEHICHAKPLGCPSILYHFSRVISPAFNWPHHKSILWPQEHGKEDLLREIVHHATLDTLGALSLLCRDGYFVGHVVSECSGHEADVGAVLLANKYVVKI